MTVLANKKSREDLEKEVNSEDFFRTTLSFYKYVTIKNIEDFRDQLYIDLEEIGVLGRIYLSTEGINAQVNVPEHNFDKFRRYIDGTDYFKDVPFKIAVEEKEKSSFIKLIVRIKDKIVADGIDDKDFDPSNTGSYVNAEQMNEAIKDPDTVVLDMRNGYEAEVGHFEGAHTMDVDTFRDQLDEVTDELKNKKDKKVVMYCTGGIRCEKASAWMKHKGFENVSHLKGGIIEYAKEVKEKDLDNKFKGKNFVFDERMGEMVGDETISKCHLCVENKCDDYTHCNNKACHILMLSCNDCTEKLDGYCSKKCQVFDKLPKGIKKTYIRNAAKKRLPQIFKKTRLRQKAEPAIK